MGSFYDVTVDYKTSKIFRHGKIRFEMFNEFLTRFTPWLKPLVRTSSDYLAPSIWVNREREPSKYVAKLSCSDSNRIDPQILLPD